MGNYVCPNMASGEMCVCVGGGGGADRSKFGL